MRPTHQLAASLLLTCLVVLCPINADEEAVPEVQNRVGSDFIFKLLPTPSEALPTQSNSQDLEVSTDGSNKDTPTTTTKLPVTTTSIAASTTHSSSNTEKIKHYAPRPRLPTEKSSISATTSSLTASKPSFIFTFIRTTLSTTRSKPSYITDEGTSDGDTNPAAGSINLGKLPTRKDNNAPEAHDGPKNVQTTVGYPSADITGGGEIGPTVWEYWYWILIGILLFIFLLLIPCFVCLIYKQKRKRKKAEEKDHEDTSEESTNKPQDSFKSTSGNSSEESQNNDPHSAADSKGSTIVITIPETTQYSFENPRKAPDDEPKMDDRTYSEPYDVRLEIGKETIIKSSEVASPPVVTLLADRLMIMQETPKINIEDTRKRTKRRHRHEKTGDKRTEVPDSRYRKRSPERQQSRSRTSRTKNTRNRSDTNAKLSSQTKSIIEAAKDLDGILAAITNLTHEYPIPEHSNPSKNKSTTKRHSSRTRHIPADTSAPKRSEGAKKHGDKRKHGKSRKDKDRKSRRRSKKKEPIGEKRKPKPDEKEADSSNKVPTLMKEELPAMDALKSEERRRRLERDLKKLQKYHNKHLADS